jgi:hypothetical protein
MALPQPLLCQRGGEFSSHLLVFVLTVIPRGVKRRKKDEKFNPSWSNKNNFLLTKHTLIVTTPLQIQIQINQTKKGKENSQSYMALLHHHPVVRRAFPLILHLTDPIKCVPSSLSGHHRPHASSAFLLPLLLLHSSSASDLTSASTSSLRALL